MPHIAIFLSDLNGGGAERVMLNLARGFAEQGVQVDLILVRAEGPYLSQIPPKVRVINLQKQRLLSSLFALVQYLKQQQPTALLSALEDTNLIALWACSLAKVSTQVVVTVHNTLSREAKQATQLKRRLTPYLIRLFYPWAIRVVAVSQGVAADLVRIGLSKQKVEVIYNPVIAPDFFVQSQAPVTHPWFAPDQPPVVLGVGRLEKQKDFVTLIRACAKLQQQRPMRLMILGEGTERQVLEQLARDLGIEQETTLLGFVENPYAYMKHATVCVLSSAWEGFGNVLVEAMASGTPVVSTNCESGPAEILADGEYGRLVAVGDSEALASAIAATLEETPNSQKLQQRALDFSLDKALVRYGKILNLL
jgi:glycosyltransferase involved in cell wall biosynthesis